MSRSPWLFITLISADKNGEKKKSQAERTAEFLARVQ